MRKPRKKKADLDLNLDSAKVDLTINRKDKTTKITLDTPIVDVELEKTKGEKLKVNVLLDPTFGAKLKNLADKFKKK